jgi:hypothetical protein
MIVKTEFRKKISEAVWMPSELFFGWSEKYIKTPLHEVSLVSNYVFEAGFWTTICGQTVFRNTLVYVSINVE